MHGKDHSGVTRSLLRKCLSRSNTVQLAYVYAHFASPERLGYQWLSVPSGDKSVKMR